ncbi:hypothetical protein HQQ94_01295 [Shewanella sp. VB17]|uniref:hypothetical protein n=1 Tax=Shewanella sp. VB17 TaxID=2739432 RepID=UPI0015652CEA|nr:hypothetical protein [Shewanella sp. VB17]NRD71901.1 hypothetical protein [Shewanella sp. VB17]
MKKFICIVSVLSTLVCFNLQAVEIKKAKVISIQAYDNGTIAVVTNKHQVQIIVQVK